MLHSVCLCNRESLPHGGPTDRSHDAHHGKHLPPDWKQKNRPFAGTFGSIERLTGSGRLCLLKKESQWAWTKLVMRTVV